MLTSSALLEAPAVFASQVAEWCSVGSRSSAAGKSRRSDDGATCDQATSQFLLEQVRPSARVIVKALPQFFSPPYVRAGYAGYQVDRGSGVREAYEVPASSVRLAAPNGLFVPIWERAHPSVPWRSPAIGEGGSSQRGVAVESPMLAMQWTELERNVDRWLTLPADWDGEDGIAPAADVVGYAKDFLKRARIAGVPVPKSYVSGDGEVGFRWVGDGVFASAAFPNDGHLVAFCRSLVGQPPLKIDMPYTSGMDLAEFLSSLRKFA